MTGIKLDIALLTNLYRSGSYSQMDLAEMFDIDKVKVHTILKYELTGRELNEIKKLVSKNRKIKKVYETD